MLFLQATTMTTNAMSRFNNSARLESVRHFGVSSRLHSCFPQIQKPAPDFAGTAVMNGDFKDIKLSDYKGKYVVLFFYPLDL